jgi:protein-disulfide isomerase
MRRPLLFTLCLLLLGSSRVVAQEKGAALLERAGMSRAKGQKGAAVVVMEISDFQCPYCGRFAREVYPRIDSAYVKTGKVQWVFVNLPLPNHANAWLAAEAALCAGGSGSSFWAMHDRLFQEQAEWSGASDPASVFRRYAQQAGAKLASYDACVAGDRTATLVLRDVLYAAAAKISGTPAFIINNDQPMVGVKDFEEWKRLLDSALAR